jgi:excisionase family DNA binding protein
MSAPLISLPPRLEGQPGLPFDRLLTIKEAAEQTGIKYWLLLRAVNEGDIPFYRFGNKRRRVRLADIEAAIIRSNGSDRTCP